MDQRRSSDGDLTIVSIAHRLSTIEQCDCVYYLGAGHIESSGTYSQLLETSVAFRQLVEANAIPLSN